MYFNSSVKSFHTITRVRDRAKSSGTCKRPSDKEVFVLAEGSDPPPCEKWWQRSKYHLAFSHHVFCQLPASRNILSQYILQQLRDSVLIEKIVVREWLVL